MTHIVFLIICAILNRARGSKLFGYTQSTTVSRIASSLGIGLVSLMVGANIWQVMIIAIGLFIWSLRGWGKYFDAFDGVDNPEETEIKWIDDIGYSLVIGVGEESVRKRGLICMCLRGVYMYPMFIALAWFNPWALLIGTGCLMQGIPYYLAKYLPSEPVKWAEMAWGLFMGLMIIGAVA